ncbi:MAG: YCF48-related protein [Patescibacteria group bacterium]|nr:YCF48-related protein [Patescibacteria group bacterium]
MFNRNFVRLAAVTFGLSLFGAGCSLTPSNQGPTGPDAGIWKSSDHGQTWVNKKALVDGPRLSAGAAEFAVQSITFDPQDRLTVYLGTKAHGLVYSIDGGDSWQRFKNLEAINVKAVAVDNKNKCTVYSASQNKIYKTKTCGRDWQIAFFDPRTDKQFTQITLDWFNPTVIYSGTNDGDIFKSTDEGVTWQIVKRANAAITYMAVSPQDSRVIYAGTDGDGVWRTLDGGITWLQIKKEFGDLGEARRVIELILDSSNANHIFLVHRTGIAESMDGGKTWTAVKLITDAGEGKITWMAIDPNNNKNLVYTGPTALVFSLDGGKTWVSKRLPATSQGSVVSVDPKDGNVIYLGTIPTAKK